MLITKRIFAGLILLLTLSAAAPLESLGQSAQPTSKFIPPAFSPDGVIGFKRWVMAQTDLSGLGSSSGDKLSALISFSVSRKGLVTNVRCEKLETEFAKRLVEVIKKSPNWVAASSDNGAIAMPMQVEFNICLVMGEEGRLCAEDVSIYRIRVDSLPKFQGGGSKAFSRWIEKQVGPVLQPDGTPASVRVVVKLVVEKDGSMSQVKVGKCELPGLKERILATLETAPRWAAATHGGEAVRLAGQFALEFGHPPVLDNSDAPVLAPQIKPSFDGGGFERFQKWVNQNLIYPQNAYYQRISGRVLAGFVVERDGSISGIKILKTPSTLLDQTVIDLLSKAPKWTPGMQDGQAVRVKYAIPIDFKLPADYQ